MGSSKTVITKVNGKMGDIMAMGNYCWKDEFTMVPLKTEFLLREEIIMQINHQAISSINRTNSNKISSSSKNNNYNKIMQRQAIQTPYPMTKCHHLHPLFN